MTKNNQTSSANTYAGVYFINETNSEVQFTFDTNCIDGLSDATVSQYSLNSQTMQTNDNIECWTTQSGGKMTCGNYSFNFELGTGYFNTDISAISSPSNFSGFLAANQYTSDNSFDFFVYSGPAILDSLVNSLLNANISALTKVLTNNQFTYKNLNILLTNCSGLDSIQASYAALIPVKDGSYLLTLILNSNSIELDGQAGYGTTTPLTNASLSTTNLSILLDIILDLTLTQDGIIIQSVSVSTLKFSLSDLSISGAIFGMSLIMTAIMNAATANIRVIEGILNDQFNDQIIGAINKDLNSNLPKTY